MIHVERRSETEPRLLDVVWVEAGLLGGIKYCGERGLRRARTLRLPTTVDMIVDISQIFLSASYTTFTIFYMNRQRFSPQRSHGGERAARSWVAETQLAVWGGGAEAGPLHGLWLKLLKESKLDRDGYESRAADAG